MVEIIVFICAIVILIIVLLDTADEHKVSVTGKCPYCHSQRFKKSFKVGIVTDDKELYRAKLCKCSLCGKLFYLKTENKR